MAIEKGTILAVLAHPDDESFGMGGTLALYAQRGVDVYLLCATRGEAGEIDPEYMDGFDSIAERRESELRCAAEQLGLTKTYFLDYRDSGMEHSPENQNPASLMQAPLEEVAEKISRLIREIQPQVVLTHDPSGGYFHPDHIKVHQAAWMAFHSAGDADKFPYQLENGLVPYQPRKLYYTAFPRGLGMLLGATISQGMPWAIRARWRVYPQYVAS